MEDTKKKGAAPTNQTISFSFRNPHDIELLEAYYFYRTTHDRRHYSRSEIIVELFSRISEVIEPVIQHLNNSLRFQQLTAKSTSK